MKYGLLVGCHQGLKKRYIVYSSSILKFIKKIISEQKIRNIRSNILNLTLKQSLLISEAVYLL